MSRRVVTTSSIPKRTRSSAGSSAHAAPASAPPTTITGSATSGGSPPTTVPMPAAAIAPSSSWPSAPMFQYPARKAMATAAPVNRIGVALTSTSSSVKGEVSGVITKAMYASIGLAPARRIGTAVIANVTRMAMTTRIGVDQIEIRIRPPFRGRP